MEDHEEVEMDYGMLHKCLLFGAPMFVVAVVFCCMQSDSTKPTLDGAANVTMTQVCADMKTYREGMLHQDDVFQLTPAAGKLTTEILAVQKSQSVHCTGWTKAEEDAVIGNAFSRSPIILQPPHQNKVELLKK